MSDRPDHTRTSRQPTYTADQMIEAIEATGGILAAAARRLGCSRNTVKRWIRDDESVKNAYEEQLETVGDEMEGRLIKLCRSESHPDHFKSLRFYLRTVQRHRGYGDRGNLQEDQPLTAIEKQLAELAWGALARQAKEGNAGAAKTILEILQASKNA